MASRTSCRIWGCFHTWPDEKQDICIDNCYHLSNLSLSCYSIIFYHVIQPLFIFVLPHFSSSLSFVGPLINISTCCCLIRAHSHIFHFLWQSLSNKTIDDGKLTTSEISPSFCPGCRINKIMNSGMIGKSECFWLYVIVSLIWFMKSNVW